MAKLIWDQEGKRFYETGIDHVTLYKKTDLGAYGKGVAWDGVTTVTESPSGAESNPQYADNIKYLDLFSVEEFGATIEAFQSPVEFDECDGTAELATGVSITQQSRRGFGLAYRTLLGNDNLLNKYGYLIHIIYGAKASPSEKSRATVNDSPEASTMSWEVSTTPVAVTGADPTSHLIINSTTADPAKLAQLEGILFGTDNTDPRLPLPDEIKSIMGGDVVVTGIGVAPSTATVETDATVTLTATLSPTGATGNVEWTSSASSTASVDENGVVTGVATGTATITASVVSGGQTYTDTCTVTVVEPTEG